MTTVDHEAVGDFVNTAIHEAGHAVVAHKLGFRVDAIRARGGVAPGEEAGRVDISNLDDSRASALVYAAGEAADWRRLRNLAANNRRARYLGHDTSDVGDFPGMSTGDMQGVREYLQANYYSGGDAKREVKAVQADAARTVAEHWDTICRVADALINASSAADYARLDRAAFLAAIGE